MVKQKKTGKNNLINKLWPTTRRSQLITALTLLVVLMIIVLLIIFWQPLIDLFSNQDRARQAIEGAGFWGPFVFMALQFLQVVFAPIPGQVVGFAGGYAFGGWLGALYSMIGTAAGFTTVFLLARRLGRPFVERFVDKKHLNKFDYLSKDKGVLIFFLIFLLPAFPDDLVCYIAGLSRIPLKTLLTISLIGRAPSVLIVSLSGAGIAEDNTWFAVVSLSLAALIFVVAVWQRNRLERFVQKFSSKDGDSSI